MGGREGEGAVVPLPRAAALQASSSEARVQAGAAGAWEEEGANVMAGVLAPCLLSGKVAGGGAALPVRSLKRKGVGGRGGRWRRGGRGRGSVRGKGQRSGRDRKSVV